MAIGLVSGDQATFGGFGAIREAGPAPTESTSFQIGSVTKLFTALLLADAVHRGEVTLDQPLTSLFPDTARHPDGRGIELADLATHTSGLPRLPPGLARQARRNRQDPYARFTLEHLTDALTVTPKRPPGGRPRYSNFGGGVLGEALARATGLSFAQLVQTRIVEPLGLCDTGIEATAAEQDVAVGHTRRGKPTVDWHLPALAGAGALRSSIRDVLVFLKAHLEPDTTGLEGPIRSVLEPRARISKRMAVGLGWHLLDRKGSRYWWHNGGTGGFRSFVGFDPSSARTSAVLANDARSVDRLGLRLLIPKANS